MKFQVWLFGGSTTNVYFKFDAADADMAQRIYDATTPVYPFDVVQIVRDNGVFDRETIARKTAYDADIEAANRSTSFVVRRSERQVCTGFAGGFVDNNDRDGFAPSTDRDM